MTIVSTHPHRYSHPMRYVAIIFICFLNLMGMASVLWMFFRRLNRIEMERWGKIHTTIPLLSRLLSLGAKPHDSIADTNREPG